MTHFAALFAVLLGLWLLLHAPNEAGAIVAGAVAACAAVALAWRFGGVSPSFAARTPQILQSSAGRLRRSALGASRVMRAALAADVTLRPALVRVRAKGAGAERAAFAASINGAPGMMVVAETADGFLVHVIDENGSDAAGIDFLEAPSSRKAAR